MTTLRLPMIRPILALCAGLALSATAQNTPKFEEVYKVLQDNLGGVSTEELNQAAIKGLLEQYPTRVILGGATNPPVTVDEVLTGTRTTLLDGSVEYFRIGRIVGDVAEKLSTAHAQILSTNKGRTRGIILDLRFADGVDYAAAGAVADLFLDSDQPILSWAGGSAQATKKTNAITKPLAILVNSQTTGAAEALAAILRESSLGLIIGSPTGGQSSIYKEFTLSDGTRLRIATDPIKLAGGKPVIVIKPDIAMTIPLEDEKAYLKDPYANLHPAPRLPGATNQMDDLQTNRIRRRMNEAELVRQQKEGNGADEESPITAAKNAPFQPTLTDPALIRGVDLVKALAVVQKTKSRD
jgi:hypothetical protein